MIDSSEIQSPFFIDSDNALGSPFGDIDDGFAIAALLKSGQPIEALSTVFGNSFEPWVYKNHQAIQKLCDFEGRLLRGAQTRWSGPTQASRYLASLDHRVRILAIGPLTNIALALRENKNIAEKISEVVFVGLNRSIPLPAFRFFDFNQSNDPRAMREVLDSEIPLTCVPCDVARNFRLSWAELEVIPGDLGKHIRTKSERWFKRSRFLKGLSTVPIWDLVAAIYVLNPGLFTTEIATVELGRMGQAVFGGIGKRPIRVVTKFDSNQLWEYFLSLVAGGLPSPAPAPEPQGRC